jgi:hypothetical protein
MAQPNPSIGEDLVRWLAFPECPDCGGRIWYLGPRGGLSINLRCEGCKAWFNAVFLIGIDQMIQRIAGRGAAAGEYEKKEF